MDPITCYQDYLQKNNFTADAAQYKVVKKLQLLFNELNLQHKFWFSRVFSGFWLTRLWRKVSTKKKIYGIYIWGSVGRGKTHLMDMFFNNLPIKRKKRLHFHAFMQMIHHELTLHKGIKKPLSVIAKKISKKYKILCIDEFFIIDIADAMILARLLDKLFYFGLVLVITSNCVPDRLYDKGLQRNRFMPAIMAINKKMHVIHLGGKHDFRYDHIKEINSFLISSDAKTATTLQQCFNKLTANQAIKTNSNILVNNRKIKCIKAATDVAWFSFDDLCNTPRSVADYIYLAQVYHTIFLADIPLLTTEMDSQARRFMQLIDELYDRRVKLIASFAVAIDKLYNGNNLNFEFKRVISRLQEMRAKKYLAKAHILHLSKAIKTTK